MTYLYLAIASGAYLLFCLFVGFVIHAGAPSDETDTPKEFQ